jgi:hypothetical protein
MISKTKASPTKHKKPRGEQLLDRIDSLAPALPVSANS